MNRCKLWELSETSYDVLIIGAGINGAGAAQQLAAGGYKVLVIEKGDFAGGATNKSSRILHCGLRHLTPGRSIWEFIFNPVKLFIACQNARNAMIARSEISSSMSQLVRPFRFYFPIFRGDPYLSWQLDYAFKLLYLLGPRDNSLEYYRYSGKYLNQVPFKKWFRDSNKLLSISSFKDYQFISAERLTLDTILDSEKLGATVRNYTLVHELKMLDEGWEAILRDVLTREEVNVKTKLILNLSGPWGNWVNQTVKSRIPDKVVGLKGSHIVTKLPEEFSDCGIMFINRAKEPMYILPWHEMHYIGLNRTPYKGKLDDVTATIDEIEWLIGEVNYILPQLNLKRKDILYAYAGIQPVTLDKNNPQGSREVVVHDLQTESIRNFLVLTGGPIWDYRNISKKLLNEVSSRITPSLDKNIPSFQPSKVTQLLRNSFSKTVDMDFSEDIIKKIILEEQTVNLEDIFLRRTGLGWTDDQGFSRIKAVANLMAEMEGWNSQRKEKEIQSYQKNIKEIFGVK